MGVDINASVALGILISPVERRVPITKYDVNTGEPYTTHISETNYEFPDGKKFDQEDFIEHDYLECVGGGYDSEIILGFLLASDDGCGPEEIDIDKDHYDQLVELLPEYKDHIKYYLYKWYS